MQRNAAATKLIKKNPYHIFQINEPKDQATIFDNQGNVSININLQPSLQNNDQILIYLDNKKIANSQKLSLNLHSIDRGVHRLQAKIIDNSGIIIKTSNEIIFYLHKAHTSD